MKELTDISCEIIAAVGAAKGCFIEAMRCVRNNQIEEAEKNFENGAENYNIGHKTHHDLISKFAQGEKIECDVLLVHAECQMMSAEDFMVLSREMIDFAKEKTNDIPG